MVRCLFDPCHPSPVCTAGSLFPSYWYSYDLRRSRVSTLIPGSLADPAIVTWFWPQNQPFLTPPCTRGKDGRGQNGPKPCFPISIDVIWGAKEFPQWIPAPDRPCHCDLILTQKSPVFEAPVFMTEAWRWPKLFQTSLVYVHRRCMCDRCVK